MPPQDAEHDTRVDRVLADLSAGESGSFGTLFDLYSARLAGLVRRRLGWRLARKIDPDDVVQSVFKSFVGLQQRQDVVCENSQALWGLLALMATRKCGHKIEYFTAACRDVRAEESIAPEFQSAGDADARRFVEAISREPNPQEEAALLETIRRLLDDLEERDRTIVQLALEGVPVADISGQVNRSERTVQRVLKRLAEALRRELPEVSAIGRGPDDPA
jgi:RNA polymerase sigma-70 factor (ECF subfamily)